MLATLVPLVVRCKEPLDAQAVGNALLGLCSSYLDHPEVLALTTLILSESRVDAFRGECLHSEAGLTSLAQGAAALFLKWHTSYTQSPLSVDGYSRLTTMYDVSARELASRTPDSSGSLSNSEAALLVRAKACFAGHPLITVRPAACFLHGFEADIVLDVRPASGGETATVNVEVDGPTHCLPSKQRLVAVRDPHLRARGVRVLRWDLLQENAFGRKFEAWLRREVG